MRMRVQRRGLRQFTVTLAIAVVAIASSQRRPSAQVTGGTLDPTFSDNGWFGTTCGGGIPFPFPPTCDDHVSAMALQADGHFVLAAPEGSWGEGGAFRLRRYRPDGSSDPTFVNEAADFSPGLDMALGVTVQPDGRIVAVGGAANGTGFAIARYLADGTLDPTFGSGGTVLTPMGYGTAQANSVVVQPDGKLLVSGWATWLPRGSSQFAVARYLEDGRLDAGFGTNGRAYLRFTGDSHASALALLPDGRFVVSGSISAAPDNVPPGFGVTRFLANGILDTSFGVAGRAVARSPQLGAAHAMVVQDDGHIVVGGVARPATDTTVFAMIGWTADGALASTFGAGGVVFTPFPSGASELHTLALQSDGKIVAGGYAARELGSGDFALARYFSNGALDPGFGSAGRVTTNFALGNYAPAQINDLVIQPDGKIVAAGIVSGGGGIGGGGGPVPAMARYLP